jgi:hypothetical protein
MSGEGFGWSPGLDMNNLHIFSIEKKALGESENNV